jgi:hypothetical protein
MKHYPEGSLVQFQNVFRDANGFAVDPEVVTVTIQAGSGPPGATLTYSGATVPAVGTLARVGVGRYATRADSTDCGGAELAALWIAPPGTGQAEKWDTVYIDPAPFTA